MILDLLTAKRREPAECIVRFDGEDAEELYPFLSELTVDTHRDGAATATLRFESRRDETGRWTVQDAGILAPWVPVEIEAAFGDAAEEVMRGYVREVRADYPQDAGATTVTVECQDESLALDREHRRTVWGADAPTDDATIVRTLTDRAGLSLDPASGAGLAALVLNQDGTDIAFLRARAEANGYELIVRQGTVYFGPMRLDAEAQATIQVYAGPDTNCTRFNAHSDGHQPDRVAFDTAPETGEETVSREIEADQPLLGTEAADSASRGLGDFTWRLRRQGALSEEELTARAQRRANDLAMKVQVEGELDGSLYGHVLRPGEPVGVDGVGEWLGGVYYVDSVTHRFSVDGYRQSFRLLRNAYGDNLESGSNPLAGIL